MTPAPSLSHSVVVLVAGIRVRVQSNDARVTDAAGSRYPLADDQRDGRCSLRIVVERAPLNRDLRANDWRLRDATHATITGPGVHAESDLAAGEAVVRVDEEFLASRGFQLSVLEGLTYALLTRRDRHPIHAAAIQRGSAALLLHGRSGVGKSTLAWAAHRAGCAVLADDSVRIQLKPSLRVWGDGTPARLRLLDDVARTDPRLRDAPRDPDGKLVVETHDGTRDWIPYADHARVCLLARGAGDVVLRPATSQEIEHAIMSAPETQLDLAPEQRTRVVRALAAPGGWHLTLSSRADDALPSVQRMLSALSSRA